jgi:HlyD family secretion protein
MLPRLTTNTGDPSTATGAVPADSVVQPGPTVAVPANSVATTKLGPRQALVKRDSIAQTMSIDGVVSAPVEVPINYQGSGKVQDVKVKPGQAVNEGDELLELDTVEISRSLDAAMARAQTSKANLAQARAQLAAQQKTAAQRLQQQQQQQQQAIADAQAGVRKAQAQLDTVMAGPSDADKHAAQQNLVNLQAVLQKAQAAQDKLQNLPDSNTVRQAKVDVTSAQIAADKANADLQALLRGPDPIVLQSAQRDVDRAKTNLQLTISSTLDPKMDPAAAKLAHDSAVADAQLAVQTAQDKLDKLQTPPAEFDVATAKQKAQAAQDTLTAANAKFAGLGDPADQQSLDAAQAAVDAATNGVADAQAKVDSLNSHPNALEIADAQDQVRRAQQALLAAQTAVQSPSDPGGVDLGSLQEAVTQDDADVASLQQQLDHAKIVAPFTGTVLSVKAKPGDTITSGKPVFTLAQPGAPIVRLQLSDDEAAQLSVGQSTTVVLDSDSGGTPTMLPGTVNKMTTAAQSGGNATAEIKVSWPSSGAPRFGIPVTANVTIQQKTDALVVPKTALRSTSGKTYVEVMDGVNKKITNVQVGITSGDTVEITSGLSEGQVVTLTS